MTILEETCARIPEPCEASGREVRLRLDCKTKPRGSLGRLEELAWRVAAMRADAQPVVGRKEIVVLCADHGVAEEGVSAYPQAVTRQMVLNFLAGGAAINVLARHAGAGVTVVDMGVVEPLPPAPGLRCERIGAGTANFTRGPAMSRAQAVAAHEAGIRIAAELADGGVMALGIGEMGIANTTSASALAAVLTGSRPEEVTGRGTGVAGTELDRKVAVVRRALAANPTDARDPIDVVARLGGFEIAGLAGVVLGAAARRVVVVADGFIASVAALVAARIAPVARGYLIASHRSPETGHGRVLEALELVPLLDLGLRLGEGTGAALAMGLIDASLRIVSEMASFEDAGVSDSGA